MFVFVFDAAALAFADRTLDLPFFLNTAITR